tara:strand:+ start:522 stop:713 length:192 start_codon:yes stop_codon:yes gene_type:complete
MQIANAVRGIYITPQWTQLHALGILVMGALQIEELVVLLKRRVVSGGKQTPLLQQMINVVMDF